ncbi:MAG: lysine--tRNA ligase, partial [Desulfurococcaceae archaeon]
ISRLKASKHLSENTTEYGARRILETIPRAYNWVMKYGTQDLKFRLNTIDESKKYASRIPSEVVSLLKVMYENLDTLSEWSENSIKEALMNVTSKLSKEEVKKLYEYFYLIIVGKPSGPRAAPLLALIGKEKTIQYFSAVLRKD